MSLVVCGILYLLTYFYINNYFLRLFLLENRILAIANLAALTCVCGGITGFEFTANYDLKKQDGSAAITFGEANSSLVFAGVAIYVAAFTTVSLISWFKSNAHRKSS